MSNLIITTPPTVEPALLAEVKGRLRLSTTDDDATISQLITVAREHAETVTGWSLAAKSYRLVDSRFPYPGTPIVLLRPPLLSVASVQYLDDTYTWQTWDDAEYFVFDENRPALIAPKKGFAYPEAVNSPGSVRVDFSAGAFDYSPFVEGIRQLTIHLYDHPEAVSSEGLKEIPTSFTNFFMSKRAHCIF
jgi:uncharacterized phiE125 gp8 family phage protein